MFRNPNLDIEDYERYDNSIGFLGISYWNENPSYKSLAMNMENEGSAIWWAYRQRSSDDTYTVKLMYVAQEFAGYEEDTLHALCGLNMHGFVIYNATINNATIRDVTLDPNDCQVDSGLNGEYLILRQGAINPDGTIDSSKTKKIRIKNGFVLS